MSRAPGGLASDGRIPTGLRLAYAAPAFGLAVVGIPVYVYLPKFYTDVVGVPVAAVGALLLAVRVFDAVSDPLIGALSDRTRTRFGRRRPWIALAPLPLAVSILLLFAPPALSEGASTAWFGATLFALFLFWTAVSVPYEALGPEITPDYDARTGLLGLRDGVLLLGTLAAASTPALVSAVFGLGDDDAGQRARFRIMAWIYAPLLIALCAVCAARVPERPLARLRTSTTAALSGLGDALANRPFRILLVSYTIAAFGSNLPATLILYYVEYVLQDPRADLFLLLYFVTGILLLPLWVVLARRVDKKAAWLGAMAINTGAFLGVFFLGPGQGDAYAVLVVLSGLGFGGTVAIPSSMQADVIDYDELRSGQRREGAYIGVWSIARKAAAALGVGLALVILGRSGYEPNVEQTPEVVFSLRVLYALVPCLLNLVAIAVALAYPIDRARHRAILAGIEERRRGGEPADPLAAGGLGNARA